MNLLSFSRAMDAMIPLLVVRFDVLPQNVYLSDVWPKSANPIRATFKCQTSRRGSIESVEMEFNDEGSLNSVKIERVRTNGGTVTERWPTVSPGKGSSLEAWLDANGYTLPPRPSCQPAADLARETGRQLGSGVEGRDAEEDRRFRQGVQLRPR